MAWNIPILLCESGSILSIAKRMYILKPTDKILLIGPEIQRSYFSSSFQSIRIRQALIKSLIDLFPSLSVLTA
jgi:hypothetical protein